MAYDFMMMRLVYMSFKLGVSICLCAGDATAHNVYRYEWLHMMFSDNFCARRFNVHMRREM
jgi:hypothetical protein